MAEPFEVARIDELAVGRMKAVVVEGRTIVLCRTEAGFFAMDNTCPHRGGPLAQGDVVGNEIVCPWHLWGFDVRTGRCPGNPEVSVTTHEVLVDGERILVRIS